MSTRICPSEAPLCLFSCTEITTPRAAQRQADRFAQLATPETFLRGPDREPSVRQSGISWRRSWEVEVHANLEDVLDVMHREVLDGRPYAGIGDGVASVVDEIPLGLDGPMPDRRQRRKRMLEAQSDQPTHVGPAHGHAALPIDERTVDERHAGTSVRGREIVVRFGVVEPAERHAGLGVKQRPDRGHPTEAHREIAVPQVSRFEARELSGIANREAILRGRERPLDAGPLKFALEAAQPLRRELPVAAGLTAEQPASGVVVEGT